MDAVATQLERIRRLGRSMLLLQRFSQWLAGLIVAALILVLIDFLLPLPGALRLALGVVALALALGSFASLMLRALRFAPGLEQIALRAERIFPQLSGIFASAVEFAAHPAAYADPQRMAAFTAASITQAQARLQGVQLSRLLNPARTARWFSIAAVAVLLIASLSLAMPHYASIAASRWLAPLGSAQWPKWAGVKIATTRQVWAGDSPVQLAAVVSKGYYHGMPVRARWRIISPTGEPSAWHTVLLTRQSPPTRAPTRASTPPTAANTPHFQRLLALPENLKRQLRENPGAPAHLQYVVSAGDDTSAPHSLTLVGRPRITQVAVTITPPTYAKGLIAPQTANLFDQTAQTPTAAGLTGSTVSLTITLNKPIPWQKNSLAALLPGMTNIHLALHPDPRDRSPATRQHIAVSFTLSKTVETALRAVDQFGLFTVDDRHFRLKAQIDKQPAVSLTVPAADESVLASAAVPVKAVAQDDVGIEDVAIRAALPAQTAASTQPTTQTIADQTGRQSDLTAAATIDLSKYKLAVGDIVTLTGTTRDVYNLHNQRHAPVTSAARRLRIIDAATLIGQLRSELAGVREAVMSLKDQQTQIAKLAARKAAPPQQSITRQIHNQQQLIDSLSKRIKENRLVAPDLDTLLKNAGKLLNSAGAASTAAAKKLNQHDKAAADQKQVGDNLDKLAALLDQQRDAMALKLELKQLRDQQADLAGQTRKLLPQTIGRRFEDLPKKLQKQLKDLANKQADLADKADALVNKLAATSQALAKQGKSDRTQAAAQALADAAATARRRGLKPNMKNSSKAVKKNQLSQAGGQQSTSLDVMDQMLSQINSADSRMQQMLRRRLAKIRDLLEQLVKDQTGELTTTHQTAEPKLPDLAPPQSGIRLRTMSVQDQATRSKQTTQLASILNNAVTSQGHAVVCLRQSQKTPATGHENDALDRLKAALTLVKKKQAEDQQQKNDDNRQALRKAYAKLAKQQQALRTKTAPYSGQNLTRRQQFTVRQLAGQESDIRKQAHALAAKTAKAVMFVQTHQQVDAAASDAAAKLSQGQADARVLDDQQQVADLLQAMADALNLNSQKKYAGSHGSNGGGGGGGGPQPAVPPLAQLKLMRGMQVLINTRSNQLAHTAGSHDDRIAELAQQQADLSAIGKQLIKQMKQQTSPPKANGVQ